MTVRANQFMKPILHLLTSFELGTHKKWKDWEKKKIYKTEKKNK